MFPPKGEEDADIADCIQFCHCLNHAVGSAVFEAVCWSREDSLSPCVFWDKPFSASNQTFHQDAASALFRPAACLVFEPDCFGSWFFGLCLASRVPAVRGFLAVLRGVAVLVVSACFVRLAVLRGVAAVAAAAFFLATLRRVAALAGSAPLPLGSVGLCPLFARCVVAAVFRPLLPAMVVILLALIYGIEYGGATAHRFRYDMHPDPHFH